MLRMICVVVALGAAAADSGYAYLVTPTTLAFTKAGKAFYFFGARL